MTLLRVLYAAMLRVFPFDADFYRLAYGDIFPFTGEAAHAHWRTRGWREGRFPSLAAVAFHGRLRGINLGRADPVSYVAWNPDAVRKGSTTREAILVRMASDRAWNKRPESVVWPNGLRTALSVATVDDSWTFTEVVPRVSSRIAAASDLEREFDMPSAEEFVIEAHRHLVGYPPGMKSLQGWLASLDSRRIWRPAVLALLLDLGPLSPETLTAETTHHDVARASLAADLARPRTTHPADDYDLMGIEVMARSEWHARAPRSMAHTQSTVAVVAPVAAPAVSVLVSLYRAESFLPGWLANVKRLTDLDDLEFIVVLVQPNDAERQLIDQLARELPRVHVIIREEPCGIYSAWNIALRHATAPYVTNMNVDDLRAPRSLEIQRSALDSYPWVDVVTSDVVVTFDPFMTWAEVERVGAVASFPLTTLPLLQSGMNAPHNGPMWRRTLHDDLGGFDESFASAGDLDFWIRCARAGKTFFASPLPSVGYFENPTGLSTSSWGAGIGEARAIHDANRDALVTGAAPSYVVPQAEFGEPMTRDARLDRGFVTEMARLRQSAGEVT